MALKQVEIYTDGACSGNPGKGGYGIILSYQGRRKEVSQGFICTTNNRMEVLSCIVALEMLKEPCEVLLYSDSKYLIDSVNKGWVFAWERNGWRKADKKPALNRDLWERLLPLLEKHAVTFHWIKGHNDHPENERCDELAVSAYLGENLIEDVNYQQK